MTAVRAAFGYHLWLVPAGHAFNRLQGVVDRLAEAYDGPVFTPHITLLSGLAADEASLIETNRRLAAGLEPFKLDLTVPEAGTTYFQCIYMRVAENPSLSRTRKAAGEGIRPPGRRLHAASELVLRRCVSGPSRDHVGGGTRARERQLHGQVDPADSGRQRAARRLALHRSGAAWQW